MGYQILIKKVLLVFRFPSRVLQTGGLRWYAVFAVRRDA